MPLIASLPAIGASLKDLKQKATGTELPDADYEDSFGLPLKDIGGRKRWVLAGTALEIWENKEDGLLKRVKEILNVNEERIYKGHDIRSARTVLTCWMIGRDKEDAHPTVVIFHSIPASVDRIKRVIKRDGILATKGFHLKVCPSCDAEPLALGFTARLTPPTNAAPQDRGPISLCGSSLAIGDHVRRATLGRVIILDGKYYGVTVAHVFTEAGRAGSQGQMVNGKNAFYDSDWSWSDSESESDSESGSSAEDSNATPRGFSAFLSRQAEEQTHSQVVESEREDGQESGHHMIQNWSEEEDVKEDENLLSHRSTSSGADIQLKQHQQFKDGRETRADNLGVEEQDLRLLVSKTGIDAVERPQGASLITDSKMDSHVKNGQESLLFHLVAMSSQHPLQEISNGHFDGYDWAIIEISDTKYQGRNGVIIDREKNSWLYFENFIAAAPRDGVLLATSRGNIKGIGVGAASSLMLLGSKTYRDVWSIQPEKILGTCQCLLLAHASITPRWTWIFRHSAVFRDYCETRCVCVGLNLYS